jgi:hypothetical protein
MKIGVLFLVFAISLVWSLCGAAEPTDTFLPGTVRNGHAKSGIAHLGKPSSEPGRDTKQGVKEIKKSQAEGDIRLYGPRDLPPVMIQAARTAAVRPWP